MFAALITIGVSAVEFNTSYYSYDINHNGEISEDEQGVAINGFNNLSEGETVTIPAEVEVQTKDGKTESKKVLALGLEGATTTMRIPGADKIGVLDLTQATNLKYILSSAFYACSNIRGKIESYTVEEIGDDAFCGCTGITQLSAVHCEEIGDRTFHGCTALESFFLLNCVTIGNSAFIYCTSLGSDNYGHIDLPACKEIGSRAFACCTNLRDIFLPDCKKIGRYAFDFCQALEYIYLANDCDYPDDVFYELFDTRDLNWGTLLQRRQKLD